VLWTNASLAEGKRPGRPTPPDSMRRAEDAATRPHLARWDWRRRRRR